MLRFTIFVFALLLLSCRNSKDFTADFQNHKFDVSVIEALPLYDTLRQIIVSNYDSFQLTNANYCFNYNYTFDSADRKRGHSTSDMPKILYPKVLELFKTIGRDRIFGFSVCKDTTVEMFIINRHLTKYVLDVRERLKWYPSSSSIKNKSFPIKDTVLSDRWQYSVWYDKRSEF
jgi:hypothetical protein